MERKSAQRSAVERRNLQPTLLDGMLAGLGGPRSNAFFEKAERFIPWQGLADSLEGIYAAHPRGGRPYWPLVTMLKCLMLQKWYGLSDEGTEEQLCERISFRRFAGLSFHDRTPDATTIQVFRDRLRREGRASELFEAVLGHLRANGLVLSEGTLVDATILDAPRGTPREDGTSTGDPCATTTAKAGQIRHGYKAHAATDTRGIITDYVFDTAKVHDSRHMDPLTEAETKAVYGDSAYMDRRRQERLETKGVFCGIIQRRVRGQTELTAAQKARNRMVSGVRAVVEHPFAWLAQMGYSRVRYRGLSRNGVDFALTAAAYNLKKAMSLACLLPAAVSAAA